MRFAFDLGSFDDVSAHADAILARLRAGTMPCDGPWPAGKVDVLARWNAEGSRAKGQSSSSSPSATRSASASGG